MTVESSGTPAKPLARGPIATTERLQVLDILRGLAIFGMVMVHINDYGRATGGGAMGATLQNAIRWFVTEKAYTTFAILFGVGCAMQLHRPPVRAGDVRWRFLRRLLGLWALMMMLIALTGRGGTVIVYAYSGAWLLFMRRWPTRALIVALVITAALTGVWNVGMGSYQWARMGVERTNAVYRSAAPPPPARQAATQEAAAAAVGTSYPKFVAANVKLSLFEHVYVWGPLHGNLFGDWQRRRPGLVLGSLGHQVMMFFVIGMVAFRRGVFHHPADHRPTLIAVMFVGSALWIIDQWRLYDIVWPMTSVLHIIPIERVAAPIQEWFIFGTGGSFLALTYIAVITLLVGLSKAWERRLAAIFGDAGRMAITNYMVQFAVLSAVFLNWGLGLRGKFTPQIVPIASVLLFGTLAVFSRWWLARFRLGPAEWVLRSVTYARLQPLRREAMPEVAAPAVV